jgi:hypothetical protein
MPILFVCFNLFAFAGIASSYQLFCLPFHVYVVFRRKSQGILIVD